MFRHFLLLLQKSRNFLYEVQHGIHRPDVRIRSEELSAAFVYLSCREDSRERFVCDADAGVGLAVLQQYVVSWRIFLYESVLEQQSVFFSVHDGVCDVHDFGDEDLCLESVHLFMEI